MSQTTDRNENNFLLDKLGRALNPRNFNIDTKLRVILTLVILFSIFVVASIGFYVSKVDSQKSAFNHMRSIREAKRQYLEDYFDLVVQQANMLSENQLVIEATHSFKYGFNTLENDVFFTKEFINTLNSELEQYYQNEYVTVLNQYLNQDYDIKSLFPQDIKTKVLQYYYIVKNEAGFKNKKNMDKAHDGSRYSTDHGMYNKRLRQLASNFGYEDVYLVDNISGQVVYSLNKNFEYGTNLISGVYKNTNIAKVFKESTVGSKNFVKLSDYELYIPSLGQPSMFVASPIFDNNEKIGVLILKISNKKISSILSSNKNWIREGLGATGQIYLVGDDHKLRSNTRPVIENKTEYLKTLRKSEISADDIYLIDKLNTNILLQDVHQSSVKQALKGEIVEDVVKDFRHKNILSSASPIQIKDLNWAIVGQIDQEETFQSFHRLRNIIVIASVLFILLSMFMGHRIALSFSTRIISIRDALIALSRGEKVRKIGDQNEDEISETVTALKQLSERMNSAAYFAQSIGSGDFNAYFEPESDDDKFGLSLTRMKDSLIKAKEEEDKRKVEDEIRNWITNGIAKFSELLRQNNDDIEKLSYSIIKELADYVKGNIAGMFILNDDDPNDVFFELKAAYAYDRKKFLEKRVDYGIGLAGTCAIEKQSIFLKEVPEDYVDISSGFGHTNPRSIFLVPLKADDTVYGIIEIGSISVFKDHEIEFIERLAESIAATLVTVRLNIKTKGLLKESEERANEIRQQEEEMRQNLEEMMATQEELERVRKEEEDKVKNLRVDLDQKEKLIFGVLNKLPGTVMIKDSKGIIRYANQEAARESYTELKKLIGTDGYFDLTPEVAQKRLDEEKAIIESGFRISWEDKEVNGEHKYYKSVMLPIKVGPEAETGLFIWNMDYSELRLKGQEESKDELYEFKEKLKNTMKELRDYKEKFGSISRGRSNDKA